MPCQISRLEEGAGDLMKKLIFLMFFLSGCAGSTGRMDAENPNERGLSYVAAAIVTSAIIRAFFNK